MRFVLPLDWTKQGLARPSDWMADRIERSNVDHVELEFEPLQGQENPFVASFLNNIPLSVGHQPQQLDPCVQAHVQVGWANHVFEEAHWIAQGIQVKQQKAQAHGEKMPKIAIGLRKMDEQVFIFEDALLQRGIGVHVHRHVGLFETEAAKALLLVLQAQMADAPRQLLLALLCHPLLRFGGHSIEQVSLLEEMLKAVSARWDREDCFEPRGGYLKRLERLKGVYPDEDMEWANKAVQTVLEAIKWPQEATLVDHLQATKRFLEQWMEAPELLIFIQTQLDALDHGMERPSSLLKLEEWQRLLKHLLQLAYQEKEPVLEESPVQILLLHELVGCSFDYVLIPDMVEGKLPLVQGSETWIKDSDRFVINQHMQRPVLRLYGDGEEASLIPSRQALEPLLWIGGLASAQKGIVLSAAAANEKGEPKQASLFFESALQALSLYKKDVHVAAFPVKNALKNESKLDKEPSGFHFDAQAFTSTFARRLGILKEFPLSASRLESLAECRMLGFFKDFLGIPLDGEAGAFLEVRLLGKLAHAVLETFFREQAHAITDHMTSLQRERLKAITLQKGQELLKKALSGHRAVHNATLEWLQTALLRMVETLVRNPPVPGVQPCAFELAIGVSNAVLQAVPLSIHGTTLYLGGVIDRVDQGPNKRVVVDYKTSTLSVLETYTQENALFKTHFQIPVYLFLLEQHQPSLSETEWFGYLISIRDGQAGRVVGGKDMKERIKNPVSDTGLTKRIEGLLSPLLEGYVPLDQGEHCATCQMRRVCRL